MTIAMIVVGGESEPLLRQEMRGRTVKACNNTKNMQSLKIWSVILPEQHGLSVPGGERRQKQ